MAKKKKYFKDKNKRYRAKKAIIAKFMYVIIYIYIYIYICIYICMYTIRLKITNKHFACTKTKAAYTQAMIGPIARQVYNNDIKYKCSITLKLNFCVFHDSLHLKVVVIVYNHGLFQADFFGISYVTRFVQGRLAW
jgi:hypothetical protein